MEKCFEQYGHHACVIEAEFPVSSVYGATLICIIFTRHAEVEKKPDTMICSFQKKQNSFQSEF